MNRIKYPWVRLKKPGDSFIWRDRRDESSLRTQAGKRGKLLRAFISVRVMGPDSVRVRLEYTI